MSSGSQEQISTMSTQKTMDYTSKEDESTSQVIIIVPASNMPGVNSNGEIGLHEPNPNLQDVTTSNVANNLQTSEPVVNIIRNTDSNRITNMRIVSLLSLSNVDLSDASTIDYSPDTYGINDSAHESQLESAKSMSASALLNIYDPEAEKVKRHLLSLGLSESLYSSNSGTYYPVLTPEQDKIDYISFKDIMNTTWSINVENMSADDIASELEYLKRTYQPTSSPKPDDTTSTASAGKISVSLIADDEQQDPTYGAPKKVKKSLRPGRKPSSMRIAAQKIFEYLKRTYQPTSSPKPDDTTSTTTKGVKPTHLQSPASTTPNKTSSKSSPKSVQKRKGSGVDNQIVPNSSPQGKDSSNSPTKKSKYGLKITHH